jgi:hypothetical protein
MFGELLLEAGAAIVAMPCSKWWPWQFTRQEEVSSFNILLIHLQRSYDPVSAALSFTLLFPIMDAISALNIAQSVAQFVEFGCCIISNTTQIYKSIHGATASQIETTFAARRLLELSERMQSSLREQTPPEQPSPPPSEPHPPEPPTLDDSTPASEVESGKWEIYERLKDEYDIESATFPVRQTSKDG